MKMKNAKGTDVEVYTAVEVNGRKFSLEPDSKSDLETDDDWEWQGAPYLKISTLPYLFDLNPMFGRDVQTVLNILKQRAIDSLPLKIELYGRVFEGMVRRHGNAYELVVGESRGASVS